MTRLEYLRGAHAAALLREFLAREHGPERSWAAGGEEALFSRFAEADPTAGKPHLEWVLRLYLSGRLRAEDLYKVPETLQLFRRVRRRLPERARDLNTYEDLPSLWRTIAPHAQSPSKRARVAGERERARAESRVLFEDEELIVAVPLTRASAQWWGRGTQWCTAAEEDNAFEEYHRQGPLVVFIVKGAKFQFHAPSDSFHDDADGPVDVEVLEPFFPRLEAAGLQSLVLALDPLAQDVGTLPLERLRSAITGWGMPLCFVPEERRDAELCRLAVAHEGTELSHVPESLRTRELCLLAVAGDGRSLQYVPFALRDRELCLTAVEKGALLGYVPDTLRDREMCLAAARRGGGFVLEFVPFALRDAELCRLAMESGPDRLEHTPWALRDRDICFRALASEGFQLAFVPERHRDREFYLAAVQEQGCTLEFVPLAMRDLELCVEAVRSEVHAWRYTPPELRPAIAAATGVDLEDEQVRVIVGGFAQLPFAERTRERCLDAARENQFDPGLAPDVLRDRETCLKFAARRIALYVPDEFRTREVCLPNVAFDPNGLASIPEGLRDREMCLAAVRGFGEQLSFVADPLRDEEMCRAAVACSGDALSHVPFALRDRALCLEAIRERAPPFEYQSGGLRDIPDSLRDEELCRTAIAGWDRGYHVHAFGLLDHIPFALRDAEICRKVVDIIPDRLMHVPHALRDASLCAAAVSMAARLRRHVPAAIREALRGR
ncbi:hypothetical protein BO221_40335 [Archangium sp. Cb G35]|uniref:DUF4116 domain-containing protein n=1 Tax=Archangium sp. Cb G35 TaxID=1920190 RepID=UPI0009371489|nr:DUF4116 domain-containing protein [Archangium sp. Cb G35]OJT18339.1 hypothetical protein BO221_40335 [Archangium sp. Cb G35]